MPTHLGCPAAACAHPVDAHRVAADPAAPGCDMCDCPRSRERVAAAVLAGGGRLLAGPPAPVPASQGEPGRRRAVRGPSTGAQRTWKRGVGPRSY